jgi:hypothetical protein
MTLPEDESKFIHVDASTFQMPLGRLAEVLAQKVYREAPKKLGGVPQYVSYDLFVMVRKAMRTYDLLFYLNADEVREGAHGWRKVYSVSAFPLIRNILDCLYNITAILQSPSTNGAWFRKSGFHKQLLAIDRDESRFGGKPEWGRYIQASREQFDVLIRASGFTVAEVNAQKEPWPTMGRYLGRKQSGGTRTAHQEFLDTFTHGQWQEYSAMAHGAFEGLLPLAMYYVDDTLPHENRPQVDELFPRIMSMHLARSAALLLCIVTELQVYFNFDDNGARINHRIHEMWNVLKVLPEIGGLFIDHYEPIMRAKGITP